MSSDRPAAGGRRCAVLGRPIAHSLSPALHRAAYAALGLARWTYDRFDVGAEELPGFVAGCDAAWRGLSLTMPLKAPVLALGDPDPLARAVGVANTLIFDDAGRRVYNTDVEGIAATLDRTGVTEVGRVVVLGTGATARSAVAAVAGRRASSITVVGRRVEAARAVADLAEGLGVAGAVLEWGRTVPSADLLISTVAAGAIEPIDGPTGAAALADRAPALIEVLYAPWPTPLAEAATAAGARVGSGLDLLVGQAVAQVRLMTGGEVDPEVLLRAGHRVLSERSRPTGQADPA